MKLGALPLLSIPTKSHETPKAPERRHLNIVQHQGKPNDKDTGPVYENFDELSRKVKNLKLGDWKVFFVTFKLFDEKHLISQLEVVVNSSLEYTVIVYGWILPNNHGIYKEYLRTVRRVTVSNLLHTIKSCCLCTGVINTNSVKLLNHSISIKHDLDHITTDQPIQVNVYKRLKDCQVLITASNICKACLDFDTDVHKELNIKSKVINTPAHPFAPLSKTHPNRVKLALFEEHAKSKQLTKQMERVQKEIQSKGIQLDNVISSDVDGIMNKNIKNMTPFMKLFWEEQQKLATKKVYHPMIIRFCLSLAAKSASAYDELRDSNVLTLPSRRTLRDYRNAIRPNTGFNNKVVQELVKATSKLTGYQRNIVLSFDEVKLRESLVFDKHSGELIGFVDLGDPDLNYSTFKDVDKFATHCIVYYIRGIASDLKFSLAYFATVGVTAVQIMTTFWKAVAILELTCNLPVIVAVSDGASPNRSFYRMHSDMDKIDNSDVVYHTVNLFAPKCFIYFVY